MSEINDIVHSYSSKVNFVFVYILEAHAADEWPIKELATEIPQHKCVEDRIACAKRFLSEYSMHKDIRIVIDNEDDAFVHQYPSWYVIFTRIKIIILVILIPCC